MNQEFLPDRRGQVQLGIGCGIGEYNLALLWRMSYSKKLHQREVLIVSDPRRSLPQIGAHEIVGVSTFKRK
jgi:hypothetical protein